jgi:hypothetical protein
MDAAAGAKEGVKVSLWHFGDIDAARFNVRFLAPFGHQHMARLSIWPAYVGY